MLSVGLHGNRHSGRQRPSESELRRSSGGRSKTAGSWNASQSDARQWLWLTHADFRVQHLNGHDGRTPMARMPTTWEERCPRLCRVQLEPADRQVVTGKVVLDVEIEGPTDPDRKAIC